jgi:hypothetical protein
MAETIERYGSKLELLLAEAGSPSAKRGRPAAHDAPRSTTKKARIEIIPMIDVVFFLLVFFMMTSLAMTIYQGLPVSLPEAASGSGRRRDCEYHGVQGRADVPQPRAVALSPFPTGCARCSPPIATSPW